MDINNKVVCPSCSQKNTWHAENPYRPFCSERCRLIDLGEWASENYRVAADPEQMSEMDFDTDENN